MSYDDSNDKTPSRKRPVEEPETPGWYGRLFSSAKKPRPTPKVEELLTSTRSILPRIDFSASRESSAVKDDSPGMNGAAAVAAENSWQSPAKQNSTSTTSLALASPPIFNIGSSVRKPYTLAKNDPIIRRRQQYKPHSRILIKNVPKKPPPGAKFDPDAIRRLLESNQVIFKPTVPLPVAPIGKRIISRNQKGGSRLAIQPLKTTTAAHKKSVSFAEATPPPPPARKLLRQETPGIGMQPSTSSSLDSATSLTKTKKKRKAPHELADGTLLTAWTMPPSVAMGVAKPDTETMAADESCHKHESKIVVSLNKRATKKGARAESVEALDQESRTNSDEALDQHIPTAKKPRKSSWGAHMYLKPGYWKCKVCSTQNRPEQTKCGSCEAVRDDDTGNQNNTSSGKKSMASTNSKNAGTAGSIGAGGFTFGAAAPGGDKTVSSSSSLFSSGSSGWNSAATQSGAPQGFKFGRKGQNDSTPSGPDSNSGFKFPAPNGGFGFSASKPSPSTSKDAKKPGFPVEQGSGGFGSKEGGKGEATSRTDKSADGAPPKQGGFVFGVKSSSGGSTSIASAPAPTPTFKFTPAKQPTSGFKFSQSEPRPPPATKPVVAEPPKTDVKQSRKKKRGATQEVSMPSFPVADIPAQTPETKNKSSSSMFGGSGGSAMSIGSVDSKSKGSTNNSEVTVAPSNPFGGNNDKGTSTSFGFGSSTTTTSNSAPANGASFTFGKKEGKSASGASKKPTFVFGGSSNKAQSTTTAQSGDRQPPSQLPPNGGGSSIPFGAAPGNGTQKPAADTATFSFGSSQGPAPSPAPASFGSTNPFPQPTSTGFGASSASTSSHGFGTSSAAPTAGTSFVGGNPAPRPPFGTNPTPAVPGTFASGGTAAAPNEFGAPAAAPPVAGGTLFTFGTGGQSTVRAGFGSAAPTFGAPAAPPAAPAAPAFGAQQSGSSFGNSSSAPFGNAPAASTATGFRFGGAAPAAPTTGTFGAPRPAAPPANTPSFNIGSSGGTSSSKTGRRRIVRARRPPGTG